jgi:hypothetical protein
MAKANAKFILHDCASVDAVSGCCSLETVYDLDATVDKVYYDNGWGGEITPEQYEKLSREKQGEYERVDTKEHSIDKSFFDKACIAVVNVKEQKNEKKALEALGFKEVGRYRSTTTSNMCALMFKKP